MKINYMENYKEILQLLKNDFNWNLTESLTETGKKLVLDTLKANEIIKENNLNRKKSCNVFYLKWIKNNNN